MILLLGCSRPCMLLFPPGYEHQDPALTVLDGERLPPHPKLPTAHLAGQHNPDWHLSHAYMSSSSLRYANIQYNRG